MMNNIMDGTWIVRFDVKKIKYRDILETLAGIDADITGEQATGLKNRGIDIYRFDGKKKTGAADVPFNEINLNNGKRIRQVGLSFPVLLNDKRWETINLTTSTLFLGSALTGQGFKVTAGKQLLPAAAVNPRLTVCDLIGFTLFEDLFLPFREFLDRLRNEFNYTGWIAAGGPLITLNPLQAAFHLPEINLMVRGEAEQVFPALLEAINNNDLNRLLEHSGFLFHRPGLLIISELGVVNRPAHLEDFRFNLEFLEKNHLETGLELNISRGCARGCIFCSAVQGKKMRKLAVSQLDELLKSVSGKLNRFGIQSPHARTININDDDILQDPDFAADSFRVIKQNGFRLWGVQTSINSFFTRKGEIDLNVIETVSDPSLYMEDRPLVWLGTDAFIKERGKKLAKQVPAEELLIQLVEEFEKRQVRNYHYWISSDYDSDWQEFSREFMLVYRLRKRFRCFDIIAHAPFLVPYASTPLYTLLSRSPDLAKRVKYKEILRSDDNLYTFPLAEHVETGFYHLNRLLNNERMNNSPGFFDSLNAKDFLSALITLYNFLRQERMDAESRDRFELAEQLKRTESSVEDLIGSEL
jgi:hypothetical protein